MESYIQLKKYLHLEKDSLRMFDRPHRGIYSIKDILKNEIILSIPHKYIVEYSKAKSILHLNDFLHNSNSVTATYLLLESKKKTSHYKAYIDTFPNNVDEYIYYYDKRRMQQLKETSIIKGVSYNYKEHLKNMKEDSKTIYHSTCCPEIKKIYSTYKEFYDDFLRFRIMVCSRIFSYDRKNREELGMVPYADLFNHSLHHANTEWYFDDITNSFIVRATQFIPKKKEILDSYGEKTNFELFLYYGFTLPHNPYSTLEFRYRTKEYILTAHSHPICIPSIEKYIQKILIHHEEKIKKKKIQDPNILTIYLDEIRIIKSILQKKCPKH